MYEALFTPSFRLSRCCLNARACALPQPPKEGVLSAAVTKRSRMRQSKRQAQVCEPVVISSNEDMGEVCNLEKDMKMLIFRYLSLEYSRCSLFIITMHFLLLQIYHFLLLQKQTNMSDCGAFAIAFAMAICNRQRPELLCFDITKMRRHLYNCLEDGLMRHRFQHLTGKDAMKQPEPKW